MGVACVEAATAGAAVVDAARCMPNRVSVETARASAIATTTTVRFMVKPPATRGMAADTLPNASPGDRSEEHTSELQSLMRISYAVFCLKKKKKHKNVTNTIKNINIIHKQEKIKTKQKKDN